MLTKILKILRNNSPKYLNIFWRILGNIYRYFMPKNTSCTQNINKYGPFNLLNNFRFRDFDNWGIDFNDCFEIGIK